MQRVVRFAGKKYEGFGSYVNNGALPGSVRLEGCSCRTLSPFFLPVFVTLTSLHLFI